MTFYTDTFSTPCGPFSVAVNTTGAVTATAFGNPQALLKRLQKCHLLSDTASAMGDYKCHLIGDIDRTAIVRNHVLEYFSGTRKNFRLKLAPAGTRFQQSVWTALQDIPFGKTVSYGQISKRIKLPSAARAVGRANSTNPICLIVPCHRVIGADGSLTGFAFGAKIKRALLELEGSIRPTAV